MRKLNQVVFVFVFCFVFFLCFLLPMKSISDRELEPAELVKDGVLRFSHCTSAEIEHLK